MIQLNFFETLEEQLLAENRFLKTEMKNVSIKSTSTKESSDKVRRRLFAENGELKKRMQSLEERLQILEKNICRS